ncbi:unnamed protein product [Kuraishia capsulata CBS 1993]|uniref:DNA-directed RNA polymerase subunit n=1 Tax=Kuraishia capsulata CBS 1993 TaxID=1382522 RepID=W6MHD2_9ASCO|nr:uncharacterized protein KUCA_T00001030001 [Kuraishia capsulata CBS 1993]CDK25063.1 unnamed protein product [Kuraishia capsulata CBS 1993]
MSVIDSRKRTNDTFTAGDSSSKKRRLDSATSVKGTTKCFNRSIARLYVSLAPQYLLDPVNGIRSQHLDPMIMTYSSSLNGVILGYSKVKILKQGSNKEEILAKISAESPFTFLWISVEFLIWSPSVGDVVEGWSYMQTQSHIGLLIHDTFNATIKRNSIPTDWTFEFSPEEEYEEAEEGAEEEESAEQRPRVRSQGQWKDGNGLSIEGKIKFTIKSVNRAGRVISVEGSLVKVDRDTLPVEATAASTQNTSLVNVPFQEPELEAEVSEIIVNASEDVIAAAEEDSSEEEDSD